MASTTHDRMCTNGAAGVAASVAGIDRQALQKLIDLLARYDLSSASTTDNSDMSAQLRAQLRTVTPTDF